MRKQTMRAGWIGALCVWLAGAPALSAQETDRWIYRGRMGGYAVIENAADQSQQIVKVGKSIGGMQVVSITADAVVLKAGEREITLARQAGYTPAHLSQFRGVPAYPHAIPAWWGRTGQALDELQVTPSWKKATPEEIFRQLMEFSGVQVSITPRATARLSQRDDVSLEAGRMRLRAAFDLVCTLLGMRWWISAAGIQVGLPGEEQPPPAAIGVQQALEFAQQQARERYDDGKPRAARPSDADLVRAALKKATLDGELRAATLGALLRELAGKAGVTLAIDPSARKRIRRGPVELQGNRETIGELLVRLAARNELGYLVEGSTVQITSRELAAEHGRRRQQELERSKQLAVAREALRAKQLAQPTGKRAPRELVALLEQSLGVPVYCDAETWALGQTFEFPGGTALQTVFDRLIAKRIYPIFQGQSLYLVRGR